MSGILVLRRLTLEDPELEDNLNYMAWFIFQETKAKINSLQIFTNFQVGTFSTWRLLQLYLLIISLNSVKNLLVKNHKNSMMWPFHFYHFPFYFIKLLMFISFSVVGGISRWKCHLFTTLPSTVNPRFFSKYH